MTILTDKRYQGLKMEEVSDMVGFANRQSFYASFFKIMNMTPREYRLRHSVNLNGQENSSKEEKAREKAKEKKAREKMAREKMAKEKKAREKKAKEKLAKAKQAKAKKSN